MLTLISPFYFFCETLRKTKTDIVTEFLMDVLPSSSSSLSCELSVISPFIATSFGSFPCTASVKTQSLNFQVKYFF